MPGCFFISQLPLRAFLSVIFHPFYLVWIGKQFKQMNQAYLRFYEELNDYLPPEKRKTRFPVRFWGSPSVKDMIEASGVPHTDVDMIIANGISVDFSFRINNGDEISIYPVFESFDITDIQHLRPAPLRDPKFVNDVQVGALAKYMRMCGFDTLYNNKFSAHDIAGISLKERRTIITRDRKILKQSNVTHGYWVRNSDPERQLQEVIKRFQLEKSIMPFVRCILCNAMLEDTPKNEIMHLLPANVRETRNEFKRCTGCSKIYWQGSHFVRMQSFIDELIKSF